MQQASVLTCCFRVMTDSIWLIVAIITLISSRFDLKMCIITRNSRANVLFCMPLIISTVFYTLCIVPNYYEIPSVACMENCFFFTSFTFTALEVCNSWRHNYESITHCVTFRITKCDCSLFSIRNEISVHLNNFPEYIKLTQISKVHIIMTRQYFLTKVQLLKRN